MTFHRKTPRHKGSPRFFKIKLGVLVSSCKKSSALFLVVCTLWIPAFAGMTVAGKAAYAEEAKAEGSEEEKSEEAAKAETPAENPARFAPDFCDFEVTFPEKPAIAQKCLPDGKCFNVNSYTMVYDLSTTVDVSVSCNPSTPAAYKQYNESVMKAALAGMVENRNLSSHDIQFTEKDGVKGAAITGVGKTGTQDKIYSAQLWIGPNSVFSVQAELIGGEHEAADKSFRDILRSVKGKAGKQVVRPKKTVIPKQNNQ